MHEYKRHIFATLTYSRDNPKEEIWQNVSSNFNRWIQRIRRGRSRAILGLPPLYKAHQWEYFRCIESHKDGYPHIHVLLQSRGSPYLVTNREFIYKPLRDYLKSSWTFGLSDFQVPKARSVGQLTYIMKYISKNKTCKTVWRKIYELQETQLAGASSVLLLALTVPLGMADVVVRPVRIQSHAVTKTISLGTIWSQQANIKLLTWSRNFDFSPFLSKK